MADAGVPQSSASSGQGAGEAGPQAVANGHASKAINAAPKKTAPAPSAKDAALKAKIEAEFTRLMAQEGMSPNEAALIAVKNVATAQTSLQA